MKLTLSQINYVLSLFTFAPRLSLQYVAGSAYRMKDPLHNASRIWFTGTGGLADLHKQSAADGKVFGVWCEEGPIIPIEKLI